MLSGPQHFWVHFIEFNIFGDWVHFTVRCWTVSSFVKSFLSVVHVSSSRLLIPRPSPQATLAGFGITLRLTFNVTKCNLGKVNLEAMLSISLWMQETCLHSWRFAGTLCDAYTQQLAAPGRRKLGVAQTPCRGSLWPLHTVCCSLSFARLISLAGSLFCEELFYHWSTENSATIPLFI